MKTLLPGAPNVTSTIPLHRARRQSRPVEEILRDIRETAALPLERAHTLPPETYTSDAFFEWETRTILHQDWLCVAHVSQLPKAGDFLTLDLLGEPLIVVHGKDGVIRTLSRVCPHRAMDIIPPGFDVPGRKHRRGRSEHDGAGHTRLFMCPYHAWTFELDGKLKARPRCSWQSALIARRRAEELPDRGLERLYFRELQWHRRARRGAVCRDGRRCRVRGIRRSSR